MEDGLRPCPFCGGAAELCENKTHDFFVRCVDTRCHARTRNHHENSVGAVMAWNERAIEDRLRELLKDTWRFIFGSTIGENSASEWHEKALSIHDRMRELGIEVE